MLHLITSQTSLIYILFTNIEPSIDLFFIFSEIFETEESNERRSFPSLSHVSFLLQINKMEHTLEGETKGIKIPRETRSEANHFTWSSELANCWTIEERVSRWIG